MDNMQKPCDIVVTTWQREWMMMGCIIALRRNTKSPYRLIIIDSGSDSGHQISYLRNSDIYIKLDKNYGLEYAKHIGMEFIESEYFISMDNDILVYEYKDKDWLKQLQELMDKYHETYAAIACKPQQLVGTSMDMFKTDKDIVEFPHVPGYARIMNTAVTKMTGAWRDKRPSRGHEEMWIGKELTKYGWKMGWANNIECWHLFGKEDTDGWGYAKDSKPEDHGHNPIWPIPTNDKQKILERTGVAI